MSYTLTIEEPAKAAWFERETAKMTPAELGELFITILSERRERRRNNSLADLAGSWVADPEMDKVFAEQEKIDEEMWK